MERVILVIIIAAIVGAGVFAGAVGFVVGDHDSWSPRQYVLVDGKCWVEAQGDFLYDRAYAQEVNPFNCQSYLVQEQANNIKADTRKVNTETTQGITLVYSLFGVLMIILCLIVVAVVRG